MPSDYQGSLKGQLLVAMPTLMDPNFHKTVTCICAHDDTGALGIVINRQDVSLAGKDLFSELKISYSPLAESIPVHIGGPVHINELFILHGPPFDWKGCLQITANLAMSNTIDILESIAMGRGPEHFIISLGCAGWGGGQLEYELKENTWITSELYEEALFEWTVDERWGMVLDKNGVDPVGLSPTAGHA